MDVTLGNPREKLYLGGDAYSAPMVYVRDNNSDWVLYDIVRDYQGSITHLVDDSDGTIVAEYSYDLWGRLRDPQTLEIYTPGSSTMPELMLGRGYTGHEHLDWFGLINMNARLYDPALGRFLSPDPYVQAPDFTQNFNRYSYCLNNPLKYTDESGEIFGTLFGLISDIIDNLVRTFKGDKWDWTQTKHGWEIDKGMFMTDQNKSPFARFWELCSRLTWQFSQTFVADLLVSVSNAFGAVNNVTHNYGLTAIDMGFEQRAVTIGYFSAGPDGYKADWRDHLFVHEYGHYIQSQQYGPAYLLTVGISSFQSAILDTGENHSPEHDYRWFEADASYKGAAYFDKCYGTGKDGYKKGSADYFNRESFIHGDKSEYINPRTGGYNWSENPVSPRFHWTDIVIYLPVVGLLPWFWY